MQTHGEEHDGDSQRHGCEDGHSHAQDQRVIWVDTAVSVQQLRLHFVWKKYGGIHLGLNVQLRAILQVKARRGFFGF